MNSTKFFYSGSNRLSFVCNADEIRKMKAGVIFVHAAQGNRLGPHRMFVEVAEKLKTSGIVSFRFDMRGCGDSQGQGAGDNINYDIEDLRNAIGWFSSTYKSVPIFLFAISRGARVSLAILARYNIPVCGAVLLSTPYAGSKAAAKKFTGSLKEYLHKFTNPESLRKLLSGKADIKQIAKTLTISLNTRKIYRLGTEDFITKAQLFFIFGEKDPIACDSAIYYRKICEKFDIPFEMAEIKNANHSFFHYRWKEHIMEMTESWIQQKINHLRA